jgi:hypothetical protein
VGEGARGVVFFDIHLITSNLSLRPAAGRLEEVQRLAQFQLEEVWFSGTEQRVEAG